MLHILAEAEGFTGKGELLLDSFERGDKARWTVAAEQVPRVETGEVLKGAEELVATDCREEDVSPGVSLEYRGAGTENMPVVATKRR